MRFSQLYKKPISNPLPQVGLDLGTWDPDVNSTNGIRLGEGSKLVLPPVTTNDRVSNGLVEREIVFDINLQEVFVGNNSSPEGSSLMENTTDDSLALLVATSQ